MSCFKHYLKLKSITSDYLFNAFNSTVQYAITASIKNIICSLLL